MKEEQIERVTLLTNLYIAGSITKEELVELDELQREWLLNSSITRENDYNVERSFTKTR